MEAARAGQHGKGFAVVAQEVRNLVSRSAEAEIAALNAAMVQPSVTQKLQVTEALEAMNQISSIVQSNSAASEETTASSEEMASQAAVLNEIITRFRLRDGKKDYLISRDAQVDVQMLDDGKIEYNIQGFAFGKY